MKKVARLVFGDTSCPEETIYKRLKDNWNRIAENIDMQDLKLFDWRKWRGTFLVKQAKNMISYLKGLLDKNTFPRDDMKGCCSWSWSG